MSTLNKSQKVVFGFLWANAEIDWTTTKTREMQNRIEKYSDMFDPDCEDLFAYLVYAIFNNHPPSQILETLYHDLNLIDDSLPQFCVPRSVGYYTDMMFDKIVK